MQFKPHSYQTYAIERTINTPKVGLFLDMGLGKTVATLSAIRELKFRRFRISKVLVIAPKKVAEGTWMREAEKWDHTKSLRLSSVLGTEKQRIAGLEAAADIYVTSRDNVVWITDFYRNRWPFDMVVVDESSSFKNHSAKRFKALARVSPKTERIVLLTGTPSPNGLMDLWSQIFLLDQGERLERRYTQFRERYFLPDRYGPNGIVYKYKPKSDAKEAIMEKISDICISMKSEDYITLPEKIENTITVRLDPKARKAYDEMEKQMILELPEEEITALSAAALSNKLLQLSAGAVYDADGAAHEVHGCKIEALLETVEALQGRPVIVFYGYKSDRARILSAMPKDIRVRCLDGPEDEDAWNRGQIDVLLAHPASCAYGLNLQDGGHDAIWFTPTWNYEQYAQANKRLHRQGQKHTVLVHHLICEGTRDEDVIRALSKKDDAQMYVMQSLKARIYDVKRGTQKCKGITH